jgi:hypothetical protein
MLRFAIPVAALHLAVGRSVRPSEKEVKLYKTLAACLSRFANPRPDDIGQIEIF